MGMNFITAVSVKASTSPCVLESASCAVQAAEFEGFAGLLLAGQKYVLGMVECPTIGQQFA